jgi:branched-chain amino acid transport system ATP-binding protein
MTVLENVMVATVFGKKRRRQSDPVKHSMDMLAFVEFPAAEDTVSEMLNAVQLKRLDLARALASDPDLLFLDELASGLTEGELTDMIAIISKIRNTGVTIVMVEHIMQVIMNLCDRLAVLQFGNKIAEGPTTEVTKDPAVQEAYFGTDE